jgi:CheY-like chemotaxis protein
MDESVLTRALEPFFTTKGVGKGTGLGLPMVQGLAEQSGGCLVLRSSKGKGTSVEVWLPVALNASRPSQETQASGSPLQPLGRVLTILVVDDDALVLRNTSALLEDLGHKVIEASSGPQALDLLRAQKRVDLVVADQAMPEMTGLHLARAIRAEWPSLPVLLATGYAEEHQEAEIDLVRLHKPFDQQGLARAMGECLRRHAETGKVLPFRPKQG